MKILVAFYSWKGHTEIVARALALNLGASIIRIEPQVEPGPGMGGKAMKALFGSKERIKLTQTDLKEIDHLVIATPVWAQKIPPYTRQYLSELTNCSRKKFSVLIEMGGSGGERAIAIVRKILEAKGMTYVASAFTIEKDVEAKKFDETLTQFIQKIQTG